MRGVTNASIHKKDLLKGHTIEAGAYGTYTRGGTITESATAERFRIGLIPVTVGKVYNIFAVGVTYAFRLVDDDNKQWFNGGWLTNPCMFVATQPFVAIIFQIANTNNAQYFNGYIRMYESEYRAEKITLDDTLANWEHYGLDTTVGQTFNDSKNTNNGRFRYNYLISTNRCPLIVMNSSPYDIGVYCYDDEEKYRLGIGWLKSETTNLALASVYPYCGINGGASSNVDIGTIQPSVIEGLNIYKLIK